MDRKDGLQPHLREETDPSLRLELMFLKGFTLYAPRLDALCETFGMATSTGYGWLRRWKRQGDAGLREEGQRTGCPLRLDEGDIASRRTVLQERPLGRGRRCAS